ncbi:MAG: hypothetical protein WDO71_12985 [Bacteroidota bacterium]
MMHWAIIPITGYYTATCKRERKDIARKMVDSMEQYCRALPSAAARAHVTFLKTTYLAETNDYTSGVAEIAFPLNDLNILARARNYFVRGMDAYYKNDADSMVKVIQQLAGERLTEETKVSGTGMQVCGNISRSAYTK